MNKNLLLSAFVSLSILFTPSLQAEGGNPEKRIKQRSNQALNEAAEQGNVEQVKWLLEEGADPNFKNSYGWAAILMSGRYSGNVEVLKLLKAGGADLYATTDGGWSLLHLAARYGASYSGEFDRFMFENYHDLNVRIENGINNNSGYTPLMLTGYGNNARFARLLLENGADPAIKKDGKTAADYAAAEKSTAVSNVLVQFAQEKKLAQEKALKEEQMAKRLERDARLPVAVRKDKYMIALTEHLKDENFQDSLHYFELLESMDVELPHSFYYFWGEALYNTGKAEESLDKLYAYINATGSDGEYYRDALSLSNKAEDQL